MHRRLTALFGTLVCVLFLVSPMASAQDVKYDSEANHDLTAEDNRRCRESIQDRDDVTCVIMYGHLFDLQNRVPINAQRPPDYAADLSKGFSASPGYEPMFDYNQLKLESSPGFVEYDGEGVKPRLHREEGLTSDVRLADDVDILGYWYLSADFDEVLSAVDRVPPENGDDPSVGVMPCLTVRMVLQEGRFFGQGERLTEGTTTKTVVTGKPLDGQEAPDAATPCPGADGEAPIDMDDVIEFEVNLGKAEQISGSQGYIVWVEWYTHAPNDPDDSDKVYQHHWNLRTGPEYAARVVLPVENPVRVESVRPQFFDGKLYVQGSINSPWGSYDVDTTTIAVEILDASGNVVASPSMEGPRLRYSVDHDGHFKPVHATFVWDYQKDQAGPGDYTVKMSANNWQWTATAENTGTIRIAENTWGSTATTSGGETTGGGDVPSSVGETPAVPLPALAMLAVALLALGRIRRRH